MQASIDSIESMGLVDGPGIRTVVFLNGCTLRCKYCHNPEMWHVKEMNVLEDDLIKKILRSKPYYGDNGGVTFSGGEPLVQSEFLLSILPKLKKENINIALDTCGATTLNAKEVLDYTDLVLLDIKHTDEYLYHDITGGGDMKVFEEFLNILNESNCDVWIRQVIIPGVNDNLEYMEKLASYLFKIKNVSRVDFLPFHTMGFEKYEKLNIKNPYKDKPAMDKIKCNELYEVFMSIYKAKGANL